MKYLNFNYNIIKKLSENLVNIPIGNLSNPKEFKVNYVHNFYIDVENDVRIGVWHYIPENLKYDDEKDSLNDNDKHFLKFLKENDNRPIVIYVHGNDRNRAVYSRRMLCSNMRHMGAHVFALDYRGYGDSTGIPSEKGVVNDVLALYTLIKTKKHKPKIYLWGHSLGTGIVGHAAKKLSLINSEPHGVILEAPFLNATQEAQEYVISPYFYNNPWIISVGTETLKKLDIQFNTAENILSIKSKILIFHAEDDLYVPYKRGVDLHEIANTNRPKSYPKVELVTIESVHGFGHNDIFLHYEIYPKIKEFIGA